MRLQISDKRLFEHILHQMEDFVADALQMLITPLAKENDMRADFNDPS